MGPLSWRVAAEGFVVAAPTLREHVPMVGCVEVVAGEGSISPPGQQGTGHCLE